MNKKTCVMYDDWMTLISSMTEQQAGELIKSIAAYRLGEEYAASDPTVLVILPMIISRLEDDAKKYEERCRKNAESGRKGGKQKQANASECKPNDHDNDHDNDLNNNARAREGLCGVLSSEGMREVMNTWIDTRSQIGRYPYASITQTISMAEAAEKKHGADKCIALINKAIAGGWKAIPWEELDQKTDTKATNKWGTMKNNEYDWENFEAQILAAQ